MNQAGNQPPTVAITQPAPAQTIFQGSSVTLSATATDAEDGTLTGMALAWSSSLDGPLGTGSPLVTTTLTAGTQALTCIVTDSGGNTGSATVSLTVLPMNTAPVVTISMPGAGASFPAGAAVTLVGSANDAEDGMLMGNALTWRSSLDGVLGTGTPLAPAAWAGLLESVTPRASDDYWTYENLGATDTGLVDVAVDGAGDTRACFFRAGRLLLY